MAVDGAVIEEQEELDASPTAEAKQKRDRSTIQFPYTDLNDAVELATKLHDRFGGQCLLQQLAAAMGQSASSGAFRLKLSNARMFGVVEQQDQRVTLSDLGHAIIRPGADQSARAQAFLNVELYRRLYEKFKDGRIPPDIGLQNVMTTLGVAQKQADRARQAFQRSAEQAGFFAWGKDRLVMPSVEIPDLSTPTLESRGSGVEQAMGRQSSLGRGGGGGSSLPPPPRRHAAIDGLLDELPPRGEAWSSDELDDWVETLRGVLRVIYKVKSTRAQQRVEPSRGEDS